MLGPPHGKWQALSIHAEERQVYLPGFPKPKRKRKTAALEEVKQRRREALSGPLEDADNWTS
ncbi:hypothetical protein EI555_010194 [Monodon monoceros]|uniref:Uncharacterized protein n=1 Tax=Monodon monoceros TaxID=40151 RepID=A0A4U1FSE1_MONMO|nr:hypothetical protein EI555_010194 [Monodon monoceros]